MSNINSGRSSEALRQQQMAQELTDTLAGKAADAQGSTDASQNPKSAKKGAKPLSANAQAGANAAAATKTDSTAPGGSAAGAVAGAAPGAGIAPVAAEAAPGDPNVLNDVNSFAVNLDDEATQGVAPLAGSISSQGEVAAQKAVSALEADFSDPTTPAETIQADVKTYALTMQQAGRGDAAASSLHDIMVASGATGDRLAQLQSQASQAGMDLSSFAAQAYDVPAAQTKLAAGLSATPPNQLDTTLNVAHYTAARLAQGDNVRSIATDLKTMGADAGGGMSAGMAAAMVALGIGDMDKNKSDAAQGQVAVTNRQVARAAQKQAQEQAQEQARQQAMSAATGGGNSGGGSSGTSGGGSNYHANTNVPVKDISSLVGRSGAVKGDFKMGMILDQNQGASPTQFMKATGVKPASISDYINSYADGRFELNRALDLIKKAKDAGIPAVDMSISAMGTAPGLSSEQKAGIQAIVDAGKAAGIEVGFRYGYEMNYGAGGAEQGGRATNHNDPSAFKKQWADVAAIVNPHRNDSPPMKMVWSPNIDSGGNLNHDKGAEAAYASWLPDDPPGGPSSIDVVGLDWYPNVNDGISVDELANGMQPIYNIAKQLNVPFIFGEVGPGGQASADGKFNLLNALNSPELKAKFPNYQGYQWFDYIKGPNQSISQDAGVANKFKAWYDQHFTASDSNAASSPASATDTSKS